MADRQKRARHRPMIGTMLCVKLASIHRRCRRHSHHQNHHHYQQQRQCQQLICQMYECNIRSCNVAFLNTQTTESGNKIDPNLILVCLLCFTLLRSFSLSVCAFVRLLPHFMPFHFISALTKSTFLNGFDFIKFSRSRAEFCYSTLQAKS